MFIRTLVVLVIAGLATDYNWVQHVQAQSNSLQRGLYGVQTRAFSSGTQGASACNRGRSRRMFQSQFATYIAGPGGVRLNPRGNGYFGTGYGVNAYGTGYYDVARSHALTAAVPRAYATGSGGAARIPGSRTGRWQPTVSILSFEPQLSRGFQLHRPYTAHEALTWEDLLYGVSKATANGTIVNEFSV